LQVENDELKTEIAPLKSENAEFKTEIAQLKVENAEFKTAIAQLKVENTQLKTEVADLKSSNLSLQSEIAKLESSNSTLKIAVANFEQYTRHFADESERTRKGNEDTIASLTLTVRRNEAMVDAQHVENVALHAQIAVLIAKLSPIS
jgi:chromosome segregation ATPase